MEVFAALRFLVIDDDELSRELVAMLLAAEGHAVTTVASGEEALTSLNRARESVPEVILTDMQMPGLSGAALATALRAALSGHTRLLAMSGSGPSQTALSGFDGFLLKPFSMEELNAALARTEREDDSARTGVGVREPGTELEMPALNEEIFAKMAKMMPGAQLGELYAMCLADARKRLAQMARLAEAGDDEGYRRAAHTVKGGCGMIGATELYVLAETAEREGLERERPPGLGLSTGTSGVKARLERFSSACDRLERILVAHAQENSLPASGE